MKWETINPNKTEIDGILKKLGLNIREFSAYYEIPYNTVRQWVNGSRTPPTYVIKLLNEKIEREAKGEQLTIFDKNVRYIIILSENSSIAHIFKTYEEANKIKEIVRAYKMIKINLSAE